MRISYKRDLFEEVKAKLLLQGFRIASLDQSQPWGGFLLIDETQSMQFAKMYFKNWKMNQYVPSHLPMKPKILVVEPKHAIAWQYHLRRAELWQVLVGEVGVIVSDSDEEGALSIKQSNELIELNPGKRHRLVGLEDWAVIAQIWHHVDAQNPSDDHDVIRLNEGFLDKQAI
jgi:mannose-6-phosphate isomerase